jgi:DNA primase
VSFSWEGGLEDYITDEVIAEVRDKADIIEVISEYVPLKKKGRNHLALCPFHAEKTPSFTVSGVKQVFHCFGCGIGGDVFGFVMKAESIAFPQAVRILAKKLGVPLPQRKVSPSVKKMIDKKEQLVKVNQLAEAYYRDVLLSREGRGAREYLKKRGIGREVIEEHRLGYAPDSWNGLVTFFLRKKVPLNLPEELGLIVAKKTGGWYDHFRGRIIFPIFDLTGKVVAFGGRTLGDDSPKYINSPESKLYRKGEILYGLHVAKRIIREQGIALIVEGYLDLLTLHQNGFKHAIATLGTAMTESHVRLLKRFTNQFITIFDPDESGAAATIRALEIFLNEEISCRVVQLPEGHDPDSFLQAGNKDVFQEMLSRAIPIVDFYIDKILSRSDLTSADEKARVVDEIYPILERIQNRIVRESYVRKLGEKLGLEEGLLVDTMKDTRRGRGERRGDLKHVITKRTYPKAEETILLIMLHFNHVIPEIVEDGVVEDFENQELKVIAKMISHTYLEKSALVVSDLLSEIEDEELKGRISELAFLEGTLEESSLEKILRDCFRRVKMRALKRQERELLGKIREVEREDRPDLLGKLLSRRQDLLAKGRDLIELYKQ